MKKRSIVYILLIIMIYLNIQAQEFVGDPTGLSDVTDTKIGQAIVGDTDINYNVKNETELDNYFRCHMVTGKSKAGAVDKNAEYEQYKSTYGKYNQWAAETFGIPKALLECSIFRETLFEVDSTSDVGARGVIQMMPGTYQGLRREIKRVYSSLLSEIRFNQLLNKHNVDEMTPEMFQPEKGSQDELDLDYLKCQQYWYTGGYYFEKLMSRKQREQEMGLKKCKIWMQQYREESVPIKGFQFYMMYAYKNANAEERKLFSKQSQIGKLAFNDIVPPNSMSTMLDNPILNIGMKAYYYKRMMGQMDRVAERKTIVGQDPVGYLMLLAGGYNAGDGALEKSVASGSSVKQWCENLVSRGGAQVKNHMLSIRRCLTKHNEVAPTGQEPTQNCKKDDGFYRKSNNPCDSSGGYKEELKPQLRADTVETKIEQ